MSWIETWLDTAIAPPLATCEAAAQQVGAAAFNVYLGGRFSGGRGWTPDLAAALSAAGFGVFGTWVSLSPGQGGYDLGYKDGLDALATAASYPVIALLNYDVEPSVWNSNPAGATTAMAGFRDAVHTSGRPCMIYGLQATLRAASGYDRFWATFDLRSEDPAASGGLAGSRAVQYVQATLAGVSWDVSHSEFSLLVAKGGPSMVEEPMKYFQWNGNQNLVRIQANGTLVHSWYAGGGWLQEALGIGFVPEQLEVSVAFQAGKSDNFSVPNQLHIWAGNSDGTVAHFWQVAGQTTWSQETLPKL